MKVIRGWHWINRRIRRKAPIGGVGLKVCGRAVGGKQAKEYLAGNGPFSDRRQHPLPGLLLLDLNLPYWSGLEVLGWIRQQPRLRWLPVVIFTSSRRPDDIVKAYDAGANGYLVKPNSLADLTTMVQSLRDFWLLQNQLPENVVSEAARLAAA